MKLYLHAVFFLTIILAYNNGCKCQNQIQVLNIEEYIVEFKTEAYDGDGNKPTYRNIISLLGKPANDHSIVRIDLNFTIDDRYQINKPIYDEAQKTSSAWYPMSEFDTYYEMCKQKTNGLRATYRYNKDLKTSALHFTVNGKISMNN